MQDNNSTHLVQIPSEDNFFLCPVRTLKALLAFRPLPPLAPLFGHNYPPYIQVIDTHVMDTLKSIILSLRISPIGHGFHSFRCSGDTFAFNHNIPLQNIMAHGLWRSSSVWTYLKNVVWALSIIPSTVSSLIPTFFLVWLAGFKNCPCVT